MPENAIGSPEAHAKPKRRVRRLTATKQRKGSDKESQRAPSQLAVRVPNLPERIETLLMQGDLTGLSVKERLGFYKALCRTLGLNPLTRPFEYIVFTDRDQDDEAPAGNDKPRGKMVLYARADCAAQLRKIYHVGTKILSRERAGEFYQVVAETYINGPGGLRTDSSIGVVWLKKRKKGQLYDLGGRELANAMMKAETKAKRRATFSICGLHILDESEIEDLTQLAFDVSETGRVIEVTDRSSLPPATDCFCCGMKPQGTTCEEAICPARFPNLTQEQHAEMVKKLRSAKVSAPSAKAEHAPLEPGPKGQEASEGPPAEIRAALAPAEYDGITLAQLPDNRWEIRGSESVLHAAREPLKKALIKAALPRLVCTSESCGKLGSQLEKLGIKFRMVNGGDTDRGV